MSTIFVFKPYSCETQWLMSLNIKPGVSRVMATLNKITRLFHQARLGNPCDALVLFRWYQSIRQTEGYFDKEIARLTKLIKRKCQDQLLFESNPGPAYRMRVTTPPSACFYRLLSKHDTLLCLVETCFMLNIFKKRRTRSKKQHFYSKGLLKLMTQVGTYNLSVQHRKEMTFSEKEQRALALAIQSEAMPIFRKGVFDDLIAWTHTG